MRLHPVQITDDEVQHYYEGFSNDTLWPLYHDALRDSTYNAQDWTAYQRGQRALRRDRWPTSPRRGRSCGSRTTTCSSSPRCCASAGPTC